jgi:hypothetical protein
VTGDAPAQARTFQLGKPRGNAMIGRNREPGEIALLLAGCTAGLLFGLILPWLPLRILALAGFPALGAALVWLPYRGRTAYRWFEIDRSYRRLLRSGAATYRSAATEAGTHLDGVEVQIGAPPGIGRVRWLSWHLDHGPLAVLLHVDRRMVTAAVEIEGPGVGSRDREDQEVLIDRFGAVLTHVANGDGYVRRLQMLARTLPADPEAHVNDVARRGDPHAPHWIAAAYDELLATVSTSSEQHRNYLIAAMPYTRELAAEAGAYGGGDNGLAKVMAREMTDVLARLADADIKLRQPLGLGDLASLIASMYDPDRPIDASVGISPRDAWPADLDGTAPTYLQSKARESATAEPWCHATAWVKEWPVTPVAVNFLAPLLVHTPDVIRTVAVTMDLEPTDVAIERMLGEKTNDDAESHRSANLGRIVDPRDDAHAHRIDQRGADLAAGAAGVNLVGYVTVSARSPDLLSRDKRTIRAAAGKSYLRLEWCDREHHRAFVNTLPFAAGIKGH